MGKKLNPLSMGLMGFASGFMQSLLEGIQTERLRQAKMMEARELAAMNAQFRKEDRADEQAWRAQEREDEQAWRAEQAKAELEGRAALTREELAARRQIAGMEIGARQSEGAADRAAREKDRQLQRELQRELLNTRLSSDDDPMTAWIGADGKPGSSLWSQMPAGAKPVQINGKNQYGKSPGQPPSTIAKPGTAGAPAWSADSFLNPYLK